MDEKVQINYEHECKLLENLVNRNQAEFAEKEKRYIDDLVRYEREIEVLKAKLSVVELIFGK